MPITNLETKRAASWTLPSPLDPRRGQDALALAPSGACRNSNLFHHQAGRAIEAAARAPTASAPHRKRWRRPAPDRAGARPDSDHRVQLKAVRAGSGSCRAGGASGASKGRLDEIAFAPGRGRHRSRSERDRHASPVLDCVATDDANAESAYCPDRRRTPRRGRDRRGSRPFRDAIDATASRRSDAGPGTRRRGPGLPGVPCGRFNAIEAPQPWSTLEPTQGTLSPC